MSSDGVSRFSSPEALASPRRHACLDTRLKLDVGLQVDVRPEGHHLDTLIRRTQAVDAAETLHDANRVPVHVVIDHAIAVLEVLPLRDAIRCKDDVDLALTFRKRGGFLRTWRETSEDILEATSRLARSRRRDCECPSPARTSGHRLRCRLRRQLVIQVGDGVSEGAEDKYLLVTRIDLTHSGFLRDQASVNAPSLASRSGVTARA